MKVVLDTNVLISAIVFGGKPRIITATRYLEELEKEGMIKQQGETGKYTFIKSPNSFNGSPLEPLRVYKSAKLGVE